MCVCICICTTGLPAPSSGREPDGRALVLNPRHYRSPGQDAFPTGASSRIGDTVRSCQTCVKRLQPHQGGRAAWVCVLLAANPPFKLNLSRRACGAGDRGTRRPKGAWRPLGPGKAPRALAGPRATRRQRRRVLGTSLISRWCVGSWLPAQRRVRLLRLTYRESRGRKRTASW